MRSDLNLATKNIDIIDYDINEMITVIENPKAVSQG